jgi:hypothetical protein
MNRDALRIRNMTAWRQTYHVREFLQNSVMKNVPVDLCATTHSHITDHAITDAWFLENKALEIPQPSHFRVQNAN